MSRVHLGMAGPIKQFVKHYTKLLNFIDETEMYPPEDKLQKKLYIARFKTTFNDTLVQLNNIKKTQIEILERGSDSNGSN